MALSVVSRGRTLTNSGGKDKAKASKHEVGSGVPEKCAQRLKAALCA